MKSARILIVEDEQLVGLAIKAYLESVGHEVPAMVSTGEEAVDQALRLLPDIVLMDVHLSGGMDGVQAASLIKEACRIPVVYLTAYTDRDILTRAKATDPYGYLLKPFDERALEVTIELALHKAATQGEQPGERRGQ